MTKKLILLTLIIIFISFATIFMVQKPSFQKEEVPDGFVRVAAIQAPSAMGEKIPNIKNLLKLIRHAAKKGAQIVVLPEAAISGYLDQNNGISWSKNSTASDFQLPVNKVAETVPGPSIRLFAKAAKRFELYLCITLIEKDDNNYYNSQVLISPKGEIIAHHRKVNTWLPGDGGWMTKGNFEPQVVKTPFGKLGLMICYDWHVMPERLAKKKADIVLYSVGWRGGNTKGWFSSSLPRKVAIPNNFALIAANWSAQTKSDIISGHGFSTIIDRSGKVLAQSAKEWGNDVIIADLLIGVK